MFGVSLPGMELYGHKCEILEQQAQCFSGQENEPNKRKRKTTLSDEK